MEGAGRTIKHISPLFLFRAACDNDHSNDSRGRNTAHEIDPLFGKPVRYHHDLASIPNRRFMIQHHINYDYWAPSEFSSWSTSLLFVLQHAMRKSRGLGQSNVLVYVMDTRTIAPSRIYYAPKVLRYFNLSSMNYRDSGKKLSEFAEGEYLIHGKLTHEKKLWHAVEFELLLPNLETVFPKLCQMNSIFQLRKWYFRSNDKATLPPEVLHSIRKIAGLFGGALEGAVAIALITSLRRDLSDESIEQLRQCLGSIKPPTLHLPFDTVSRLAAKLVHLQWREVPEARQFMVLLQLLDEGAFRGQGRTLGSIAGDTTTRKRKSSDGSQEIITSNSHSTSSAIKKQRTGTQERRRAALRAATLRAAMKKDVITVVDD